MGPASLTAAADAVKIAVNAKLRIQGSAVPDRPSRGAATVSREARKFGQWVNELTGLPVVFFDERYTTSEAEDTLIAAGLKRRKVVTNIER